MISRSRSPARVAVVGVQGAADGLIDVKRHDDRFQQHDGGDVERAQDQKQRQAGGKDRVVIGLGHGGRTQGRGELHSFRKLF